MRSRYEALESRPVDAFRKNLDVVVGPAADVEGIAVRGERDTDETVSDRDRLRHRRRGQVDDVKRARREVAGGGDRRLGAIRADCDAERPIVDLDLRSRRSDRLAIRQQHAAVGCRPTSEIATLAATIDTSTR